MAHVSYNGMQATLSDRMETGRMIVIAAKPTRQPRVPGTARVTPPHALLRQRRRFTPPSRHTVAHGPVQPASFISTYQSIISALIVVPILFGSPRSEERRMPSLRPMRKTGTAVRMWRRARSCAGCGDGWLGHLCWNRGRGVLGRSMSPTLHSS
jgi:hypothetical protein